jgi:transcriptional regulator with XRE-family HTH domain
MHTETSNHPRGSQVALADTKSKKLGRKNVNQLSRLALLLEKVTSTSNRTQREIAEEAGFKNQNMITMIKQGDAKLPLDRVPAMAHALRIEPLQLFNLALEQFYQDEALKELQAILPPALTPAEKELIDIVREAGKKGNALTPAHLEKIRELLA